MAASMRQALACRPCGASGETGEAAVTITRIIFTLLLAVVLWACVTVFARADVRILESPGGQVGPFLDMFDKVAASGERVVIDGPCMSACTLVLSVVAHDRICGTRRAVRGFHAARSLERRGGLHGEAGAAADVLA